VALTRGSLAIAEPLVYPKVCDITVRRQRSAVAVYSGNRFTLACRNGWESNTWILPAAFRRHATDTTYRDRVVAASRRQRSLSCPQPGASTARQLPTHLPGADLVRSWISAAIQQLHHCCWLLSGQLSTAYCRHITFDLAWKKLLIRFANAWMHAFRLVVDWTVWTFDMNFMQKYFGCFFRNVMDCVTY